MNLAQALRKKNELVSLIGKLENRSYQAMSYLEGRETYTIEDYKKMRSDLNEARDSLVSLKIAINKANREEINGHCVQDLIVKKGETKAILDFHRRMRSSLEGSPYERFDEDAPKTIYRENAKALDSEIDDIEKTLRLFDDMISDLNGTVTVDWSE